MNESELPPPFPVYVRAHTIPRDVWETQSGKFLFSLSAPPFLPEANAIFVREEIEGKGIQPTKFRLVGMFRFHDEGKHKRWHCDRVIDAEKLEAIKKVLIGFRF